MPEIYTLRAPEHLHNNNVRRPLSSAKVKKTPTPSNRKPEMYYLKPNNEKRSVSYDLLKPSSTPVSTKSNQRPTTGTINVKRKSPVPYQPLLDRKPEMYYIKSNDVEATPSNDLIKPSSAPHQKTTQSRVKPVSANTKRKSPIPYQPLNEPKPEMYHLVTEDEKIPPSTNLVHERPKSNGIITRSDSPFPKTVNTYTITAPNDDHFLPYITRTPSPPVS